MWEVFLDWYRRRFSDPAAVILLFVLIAGILVVVFLGHILAPLLMGLVFAFILESVVGFFQKRLRFSRGLAVAVVYSLFIALLVIGVVGLLPLLWQQFSQVAADLPNMMVKFHQYFLTLPKNYPTLFTDSTVKDLIATTNAQTEKVSQLGHLVVSVSVASLPSLISWLVYLFLVPFVVLFMLKDKERLMAFAERYMPKDRSLVDRVAHEMHRQLGNYIRGKAIEIIIVAIATYLGFLAFHLNYAPLLASVVGLSVVIPYIGMVIVTIPVVLVGIMQFGVTPEFAYMMLVYLLIQGLDGNLLVPILFSEAVNLHPIAIIAAVLFFGGIWGFWGLFFAIPLATLVKAVINAWSRRDVVDVVGEVK